MVVGWLAGSLFVCALLLLLLAPPRLFLSFFGTFFFICYVFSLCVCVCRCPAVDIRPSLPLLDIPTMTLPP
ncbi:hypothetical protein B0H14DRAFT_2713978 [Mycena olivaceomarginata]|nr:hypothetical protein B0H14DRAFT_2713978 [Mycena olivaceomarginata]